MLLTVLDRYKKITVLKKRPFQVIVAKLRLFTSVLAIPYPKLLSHESTYSFQRYT